MHLVIAKVTDLREEGGICYRSLPETSDDISSDLFQSFNCWFQCLPSWLAVGLPALVGLQMHLKSLLPTTREAADHDFSPSVGTSTHQYPLIHSPLLPHLLIQRHSHASADMKEDLFTGGCKVRHSHVLGKGTGQPSQVARMGAQLNLGEGGGHYTT